MTRTEFIDLLKKQQHANWKIRMNEGAGFAMLEIHPNIDTDQMRSDAQRLVVAVEAECVAIENIRIFENMSDVDFASLNLKTEDALEKFGRLVHKIESTNE